MKIGVIGVGNMGGAIVEGIINAKIVLKSDIFLYDKYANLDKFSNTNICLNEIEVVKQSELIIIAVKPDGYELVLNLIKDYSDSKIIMTLAAGISNKFIEDILGEKSKVVRTMPNTPVMVNSGVTGVAFNANILEDEKAFIIKLISSYGKCFEIDENLFHIYTAIAGSLPAYIYLFIEEVVRVAINNGLSKDDAIAIVANTVLGSAKMVLETSKYPDILRKEVTSPNGTTQKAIESFIENDFGKIIEKAIIACVDRSKEMSK